MSEIKNNRTKFNASSLLNVVTLLIAVISLIFAWQANGIASKQVNDQLVFLEIRTGGQGTSYGTAECWHQIQLVNLGGAPAIITTFSATIYFQGQRVRLNGMKGGFIYKDQSVASELGDSVIIFLPGIISRMPAEPIGSEEFLSLPLRFDEYSSKKIFARVNFPYDGASYEFPDPLSMLGLDDPWYVHDDQYVPNGFSPVEVIYTLETASGQQATSPRVLCRPMKKKSN